MSKPRKGSKLVQLRLPAELHDLLRKVAASDRRSIANLVTCIVAERLGYEKTSKVSAEDADRMVGLKTFDYPGNVDRLNDDGKTFREEV